VTERTPPRWARFEQPGVVSLWLFRQPENPADAGKDILKEMCGVDSYDIDFREGVEHDAPKPVAQLLELLSYSASFRESAIAAAERLNVTEAYAVVAQYDFAYDPARATRPVARDPMFLGTFAWRE
jgi:hypothetical protein